MDTEQARFVLAKSAFGGGVAWGLYTLLFTWRTGQVLSRSEWARIGVNILAGVAVGVLAAYFLGPTMQTYLPAQLADPYAVGFAIGLGSWEAIPFVRALFRRHAAKFAKGDS